MRVRFKLCTPTATAPVTRKGEAGIDLHADHNETIPPGRVARVSLGVAFEIPEGYFGDLRGRSGNSGRANVVLHGTVDSSYRGEVSAILYNASAWPWEVKRGHRVTQMVVLETPEVELEAASELSETARGAAGFGSTGR